MKIETVFNRKPTNNHSQRTTARDFFVDAFSCGGMFEFIEAQKNEADTVKITIENIGVPFARVRVTKTL